MKTTATWMAFFALGIVAAATASAQEGDGRKEAATVIRMYVEQAPGLLADMQLLRGSRGGQQWAEVRREVAQGKETTELVRIPAGVSLRTGDRVLVAAARTEGSASTGSSSPARAPLDMPERLVDLSAVRAAGARPGDLWATRAAGTPPLAVVPGSCIPF